MHLKVSSGHFFSASIYYDKHIDVHKHRVRQVYTPGLQTGRIDKFPIIIAEYE